MLTTTGYSIAEANTILFIIVGLSTAAISVFSVNYRKEIEAFLRQTAVIER
ncbi:hypothetical protein HRED_05643 [Candidatus Haloredivivus sp. G17]|nr:hypothetical protein HRED_05643 [Candidatus Haloredivivus sp. G17]